MPTQRNNHEGLGNESKSFFADSLPRIGKLACCGLDAGRASHHHRVAFPVRRRRQVDAARLDAGGYLDASRWLLAELYHWMASNAAVLKVVNLLNIWGLILIGVALIVGALTRLAALAGIALLLLYWLANPPLVGLGLAMPAEGHYLVINKNVVEMLALAVVAAMSAGQYFGLDRLLNDVIRSRRSDTGGKGDRRHARANCC